MTVMLAMTDADYAPRYSADHVLGGQVHDYLKRELADPSWLWLIPRCQEGQMYPARHPALEMREELPGVDHVCPGCVACRRRNQSEHR